MVEPKRPAMIGVGVAATAILALAAWVLLAPGEPDPNVQAEDSITPRADAPAFTTAPETGSGGTAQGRTPTPRAPEDPFPNPPPAMPPSLLADLFPEDDPAWGWAEVDLDALRAEMPNNAAFELAVPSEDPRVLADRQATRERWKREYGEIVRNRASEPEIRDYYAERQKVSRDYVEFTDVLIERYGDTLNDQDLGLLQLAATLHRARLEELPGRLTRSIERHSEHERMREAWLADEAAFKGAEEPDAAPTLPR